MPCSALTTALEAAGTNGNLASSSLMPFPPLYPQVVQVCAEHKKAAKLQRHLERIKEAAKGLRNPPRVLIFANRRACTGRVLRDGCSAGQTSACITAAVLLLFWPPLLLSSIWFPA